MLDRSDEWIIGENPQGSRQYIVHTSPPRFIAGFLHTYDGNGAYEIQAVDWIDPLPDANAVAQLMRKARDAIWRYDLRMEYEVNPDEEEP